MHLVALAIFLAYCRVRIATANHHHHGSKLIFAQVVFRHGDRNPLGPYPEDPYKNEINWPEGYGQLTKIGMQQEYQLGQYLRHRYRHLIPKNAIPNKVAHIQSTAVHRTLMSAAALSAGLFPPSIYRRFNPNLEWQPVPIYSLPNEIDYLLSPDKPCPLYFSMVKKNLESTEYRNWRSRHEALYKYLEEHSGKSMKRPTDIIFLHDTLKVQQIKNLTIPHWAKKIYDKLEELVYFEGRVFTGSREMSRLRAGFLVHEILQRFSNRTKGPLSPDRSLWLYSAHDINLLHILNVLNLPDPELPPYAASILFELHEDKGEHYLQIFYKKTNAEVIPPLDIPKCGPKCPINKFQEIYREILPLDDFDTECRLQ